MPRHKRDIGIHRLELHSCNNRDMEESVRSFITIELFAFKSIILNYHTVPSC